MPRPVALITGASRGIGRACAKALAREFDIAIHYQQNADAAQSLKSELSSAGSRVEIFAADLSQKGEAAKLVDAIAEKLGPPIALVHAAGSIIEKPLAFTSPDEFGKMLELHAISAALLSQSLMRYMRKSDRGRIVLIGSLAGEIGLGNAAAYAAAKGALNGLCRSMTLEIARWKATVNVIAPGYVSTEMTAGQEAERRASIEKAIPLSRFATPEEIAALAAFLCSTEAAYITGQTIVVDGGMSLG